MASESSNATGVGVSPYDWYKSGNITTMEVDAKKGDESHQKEEGAPCDKKYNVSPGSMETESGEDEWCPLFMTSLPRDFESHSGLAAIAALLEEQEEDDDVSKRRVVTEPKEEQRPVAMPVKGGGKCARAKKSGVLKSKSRPYTVARIGKGQGTRGRETTIGEAQLFLQMWKI